MLLFQLALELFALISAFRNLDGIVLFRCTESLEHTYLLSSFIRGIKVSYYLLVKPLSIGSNTRLLCTL